MSTLPRPQKPKSKLSFYNLKERFRNRSDPHKATSVDWSNLHLSKSPDETPEWAGEDLYFSKSTGASPHSSTLFLSPRSQETLSPQHEGRPPPVRRATADGLSYSAPVPTRSASDDFFSARVAEYRQAQYASSSLDMAKVQSHEGSKGKISKTKALAAGAIAFVTREEVKDVFTRLKETFNGLPIEVPGLIHVLDDLSKIHPSVAIAVVAFKAAYNMMKTRRDNDKRITFLHASMFDMMSAFTELRNVKDRQMTDERGEDLEGRLARISRMIADDIKECQFACDIYSKKKVVVKVLKSQQWESKLSGFVSVFVERRRELEFALAIFTANAVNDMGATIAEANEKLTELTSLVLQMFQKECRGANEIELARKVEDLGGTKVVENNDAALSELVGFGDASAQKEAGASGLTTMLQASTVKSSTFTLQDLKDELHEDWQATVEKHMKTFEGKFDLYQRQLTEELHKTVKSEGDRVINELSKGPHDKIKNKELKEIWKDMDWKLNVKARLFVMTLRDQYRERAHPSSTSLYEVTPDDWAFEYINTKYLQPIMEAFDDDGSGYITYQEVNEFVEAMPEELNWSLPHWIAYWAVGLQASSSRYCQKILALLNQMFALLKDVLPQNRYWADYYLQHVWPVAYELIKALHPASVPEHIESKFQAYVDFEEERIRRNLADIKFDIDALDTVYVVAGPGRIEKYLFPMVYLLLKRDLQVFNAAKKVVLHKEELLDSADSLLWVFRAVNYRYLDLSALLKQHHLNVDSQMKVIACGLFDFLHDPTALWTWRNLQTSGDENYVRLEDSTPTTDGNSLAVLNYPVQNDHNFKCELYEQSSEQASEVDHYARLPVRAILGEWSGYVYNEEQYPSQLMLSFRAHARSVSDTQHFVATGIHDAVSFDVTGRCWTDHEGITRVQFSIKFRKQYNTQYFAGHLEDNITLVGTVGYDEWPESHNQQFLLKNGIARRHLRFRPSPNELAQDKSRALWGFATQAVLHDVRRRRWTWSYMKERQDLRTRYIELSMRVAVYGRTPSPEDLHEWTECMRAVSPVDASFFRILRDTRLKTIPKHNYSCLACKCTIGGARVICMDCLSSQTEARTIDFCDNPECFGKTISLDIRDSTRQHLPSHDLFKVRTVLHLKDVPALLANAENALSVSREYSQSLSRAEHNCSNDSGVATSVEEGLRVDTTSQPGVRCNVFQGSVSPSAKCWFCVDCFASEKQVFICSECEEATLLQCTHCHAPFRQPTWYYGGQLADNFMCNTCTVRRKPAPPINRKLQHVYTHTLVRCTRTSSREPAPVTRSSEERLSALEDTVWTLNNKVDRMEATLSRIERLLLANMASGKRLSAASFRLSNDGNPLSLSSPMKTKYDCLPPDNL